MNRTYILVTLLTISIATSTMIMTRHDDRSPEKTIEDLYDAIESAEEKGDYSCCIEPACTMCYLGHWKFEKGTCYCDQAIAAGTYEDVCPACESGLEKGLCESTKEDCALNEEVKK